MVKALVLGDSIAQGYDGHTTVSTPWPAYVANKLGWLIDNKSIGGTSVVNGKNSLLVRLESFTYSDYDRIFLAYGTNDYGSSNVNLDDFNKGYERAIKYIKGSAPNAIVYIVMPIQSWLLADSMDVPNNQRITQNQLCDAERSLAVRTGCSFYDWRDNPVVNEHNRTTYLGDSVVHPTQNTYELLATALIERMINVAELVKIFNGMDDGGSKIDDNFKALNANSPVISAWSTTGLVFKNGFAVYGNAKSSLYYRTVDSGGKRTIELAGRIKTPQLASNASSLPMCNIPVSLFEGYTDFVHQNEQFTCFWSDQWQKIKLDPATGNLEISNMSMRGDKSIAPSSIEINYSVTW